MSKLLSVAIPAYNVQDYIGVCLSTLCDKELENKIEVLVINDGSTDCTQQIIDGYKKKFPNMIKCIYKENGGHGSAINLGIKLASGKYFKILDGDDFVDKKNLKILVEKLEKIDSDIVVTNYLEYYEYNHKIKRKSYLCNNLKYGKKYNLNDIYSRYYIRMHEMIIRAEIIQDNNIELDEKCFYVDQEYILYPIPYIKNIVFLNLDIYFYRLGRKEQSMNMVKMREHANEHMFVLGRLLQFYERISKNEYNMETIRYIEKGISYMLCSQIKIYLSFPMSNKYMNKIKKLDEMILNKYPNIFYTVKNKSIWIMRISQYKCYYIGNVLLGIQERIKRGL